MKTVLFVLGSYYPNPSANGLCCEKIIKLMKRKGYRVLTLSAEQDGAPCNQATAFEDAFFFKTLFPYRMRWKYQNSRSRFQKCLYGAAHFIGKWMLFFTATVCYPYYNPCLSGRIRKSIERIYHQQQFDVLIGVSYPTDGAAAVSAFGKKHPQTLCINYFLDPFVDARKHKFYSFRCAQKKALRAERCVVAGSNLVIAQKEHRDHYVRYYPDMTDRKIRFLGVPMLEHHPCAQPENTRPQAIFAGSLWPDVRNPKFIIEVMKLLPETDFHIYTPASETWLSEFIEGAENVLVHGRVSHEEIERIFENADLLINIGNSLENSSPSKLMEYMGYCKPIVSTYRLEHDSCITIMEKYPLGIALDERMEPAAAAEAVRELLKAPKNVEFAKIKELFREQTPEAFLELTEQARTDRK